MDANQTMELLRAFLAQSGQQSASSNPFITQERSPLQAQQSREQPPQLYFDTLSNATPSYPLHQFQQPSVPPTSSLDMCAPSLASFALAGVNGFSLPPQTAPSFNLAPLPAMERPPPLPARRRELTEQERFLVFVKILFKCLEKSDDPRLKPRAKAVVTECTRGNRMGDTNYIPLQEALEHRLRRQVGETYWTRAKLYYDQYMQRRGFGSRNDVEITRITAYV